MNVESALHNEEIVLVTRRFPYNHGEVAAESYLENEIIHLAAAFKRVIVLATEAPRQTAIVQEVPGNVRAVPLGARISKTARIQYLIGGLWSMMFRKSIRGVKCAYDGQKGAAQNAFKAYFWGRTVDKYKLMVKAIEGVGVIPSCIYSFWMYDTALASVMVARDLNCAVVSRAHGYDLYGERNRFSFIPFQEAMLDKLDLVFPCSLDGERYLRSKYPEMRNKIECLRLGTAEFQDCQPAGCSSSFDLVSCSRMVGLKRVELIAGAMRLLDQEGFKGSWTHFGDGPAKSEVERIVAGVHNIKVNLMGNRSNSEVLNYYANNHVSLFVNVSTSEGVPISIMEAMGFGIPVLATDVGGTSELVRSEKNGVLIGVEIDERGIAEQINALSHMPASEYGLMRIAARDTWQKKCRTKANVEDLLIRIERLTREKGCGSE